MIHMKTSLSGKNFELKIDLDMQIRGYLTVWNQICKLI